MAGQGLGEEVAGRAMNIIHLRDFGQQLIAGRNITASFVDLTVNLDCTLLDLAALCPCFGGPAIFIP